MFKDRNFTVYTVTAWHALPDDVDDISPET